MYTILFSSQVISNQHLVTSSQHIQMQKMMQMQLLAKYAKPSVSHDLSLGVKTCILCDLMLTVEKQKKLWLSQFVCTKLPFLGSGNDCCSSPGMCDATQLPFTSELFKKLIFFFIIAIIIHNILAVIHETCRLFNVWFLRSCLLILILFVEISQWSVSHLSGVRCPSSLLSYLSSAALNCSASQLL